MDGGRLARGSSLRAGGMKNQARVGARAAGVWSHAHLESPKDMVPIDKTPKIEYDRLEFHSLRRGTEGSKSVLARRTKCFPRRATAVPVWDREAGAGSLPGMQGREAT